MDLSNLHTPAVVMLYSRIIGCCGGSRCGGADPIYVVKKLCNWSRRISAVSLLSQTSEPFLLGGLFQYCLALCFLSRRVLSCLSGVLGLW